MAKRVICPPMTAVMPVLTPPTRQTFPVAPR
jgi:hypothetical protein